MLDNRSFFGSNWGVLNSLLRSRVCLGHEVIELSDALVSSFDYPDGVSYALVSVEGDGMRYWGDGSLPAVDAGHYFGDGGVFDVIGISNLRSFRAIGTTNLCKLMVSYYK